MPDVDHDRYLIVEDAATGERLRTLEEGEGQIARLEEKLAQLQQGRD